MQTIEEILTYKITEAFKQCFNVKIFANDVKIEKTHYGFQGDLTFIVFPFVKLLKVPADYIAQKIGEYLKQTVSEVVDIQIVKGFLNITVSDIYYIKWLKDNFNNNNFKCPKLNIPPIVLEFSSPNTNKPLHLGHIRNNLLGWSLSQILEAAGYNVIKVNLINDRGIHICKSMLGYMKWGNGETPENTGIKGDKFVGKYYVLFETQYKKEVQELIALGIPETEALLKAPLIIEAQEILRKWETGDEKIVSLWKKMNLWVLNGFNETYNRLKIYFDKIYYESDIYQLGKNIIKWGLANNTVFAEEDGSIWADFTNEGLDKKLLLRSDGTSVYITQDIGVAVQRYDEYKPYKMIYVVGNEQIYHFDVLKRIIKKLGFEWYDKIYHLSYGMVELPEGKMKTREGKVVDADDLMDQMFETAKNITTELGKIDDLNDEDARNLYEMIGLGALKYFILKVDPKKNMLFNPDESIDFNGNTGPFIQYTYARINSLLKKAVEAGNNFYTYDINFNILSVEKNLIKLLKEYKIIIKQAAEELNPAIVANYVYELSKLFNQFYQEIPILKEKDNNIKSFRLALACLTSYVIKDSLLLLGIDAPAQM